MASAELEPITGVQGQSPWSGCQGGEAPLKLKAYFGHWMSNGAGKFSPFPKMHLYFYSRCNGRNDIGKICRNPGGSGDLLAPSWGRPCL